MTDSVWSSSIAHAPAYTLSSISPTHSAAKSEIIGLIRFPSFNAYFRGSQNSDSEYNSNSFCKAESIFSMYLLYTSKSGLISMFFLSKNYLIKIF